MSYIDQWCIIRALILYRGENGYKSNGKKTQLFCFTGHVGLWKKIQLFCFTGHLGLSFKKDLSPKINFSYGLCIYIHMLNVDRSSKD